MKDVASREDALRTAGALTAKKATHGITMETVADTATRKVKQGSRVIGFITYFPAVRSIGRREGWTFIANRKDIAERYPAPSPVFDDPKAVLRDVQEKLG